MMLDAKKNKFFNWKKTKDKRYRPANDPASITNE